MCLRCFFFRTTIRSN